MKKIITILCFALGLNANAQIPFFETYSNGNDTSYVFESVAEGANNTLIAAGYKIYCNSTPTQCFGEGYVLKTDALGNKIWEKSYSVGSGRDLELYDIIPANDSDGFIICGLTEERSEAELDFYIAKIDNEGNVIWQNSYGIAAIRDWAYEVKGTAEGGYIVVGWTALQNNNLSLLKISENGGVIWQKDYGTTSSDYGLAVEVTDNNEILAAGKSGGMIPSGFIVKADANGDTIWTKIYEGIYDIRSIEKDVNGAFTISGFVIEPYSSAFLAKCDSTGSIIWLKKYVDVSQSWSFDHKKVSDGGYIMAIIKSGITDYDFSIIRTDDTGAVMWERSADALNDYAKTIIYLSDKGFLLSGNSGKKATLLKLGNNGELSPLSIVDKFNFQPQFKVSPNPAKSTINLQYNNLHIQSLTLTDLSGRVIKTFPAESKSLNVSGIAAGLYFLQVEAEEGKTAEKVEIR